MNKFNTSIITAVFLISGNVTLTSCTGTIEDIADGLVNGIADQIVDAKGQKEREEKEKQERLNNLLNWVIGSEVDQEAINLFGYDNCFLVTEVPTTTWDKVGADGISPNVDRNGLCLMRCLCYSYSISGYAPHVGGLICNKRIASDLSNIFRELYEAKYIVVQTDASLAYDKWKMKSYNYTYGYYYNPEEAEAIPMAQQQGLSVAVNSDKPLTRNDIAVRLFKERGFTWGGDEPNGDTNYFSKQ
jgi:hypothetical protein